jgi:UDP-glucose 4-epimerase
LIRAIDTPANDIENLAYGDARTTREIVDTFKEVNNVDFKVNELPRRPGDLEANHLDKPSKYMVQRYSYEEMLKLY